jgi:prefoldin subunit 5
MKPQEQIAQLEKENSQLKAEVDSLKKRLSEMEAAKPKSKSRQQAEQGLEMLKAGPVTKEQFAKLNPKYPSDVVYYIKTMLKIDVKTVRTANGSVYMLTDQFQKYQEGLAAEKATQAAAKAEVKAEAKESLPQAPAQVVARQGIVPATAARI